MWTCLDIVFLSFLNLSTLVFVPPVTVQCTKDAHFIVVFAKDTTLPNIDVESLSLLAPGQGCTHVDSNSVFGIYHFPVTGCGSVVAVRPNLLYFPTSKDNFERHCIQPFLPFVGGAWCYNLWEQDVFLTWGCNWSCWNYYQGQQIWVGNHISNKFLVST